MKLKIQTLHYCATQYRALQVEFIKSKNPARRELCRKEIANAATAGDKAAEALREMLEVTEKVTPEVAIGRALYLAYTDAREKFFSWLNDRNDTNVRSLRAAENKLSELLRSTKAEVYRNDLRS